MVREALVGSVTCAAPLVSFQISQVSTFPNNSSRGCDPVASIIQRILLAEKYASMISPVFFSIASRGFSASQYAAVRRHCHTMAGAMGWPVWRFHTIVVSR